jgi:hypothetical protein
MVFLWLMFDIIIVATVYIVFSSLRGVLIGASKARPT